jgi:HAD superfamily hydrolase (TIGR01509 family)
MNIIIPLGGKGERFSKMGYTQPKPLIKIFDKCMIEYVLDNLNISKDDNIFIIYNKNLEIYDFEKYVKSKYSSINFIKINDTKGAAETLFVGTDIILNNYNYHDKCLILDCDTFYTQDIRNIFNNSNDNLVFFTKNYETQPIYSYIELDNHNKIINIKEKIKISDNANTGAYAFNDIKMLNKFCKHVLDNNITFNNEPYTSCVISEMIKENVLFKGYELNEKNVFSLGTPDAVNKYINDTYAFLFDLDGTLVVTDDIYFDVWYEILCKYNIELTKDIFNNFIQGNNDKYVINLLLKNINITLDELSKLKDSLFIKHINKIKIIDGIHEMLNKIKLLGYKICIVTNCNREIANQITKYININRLIDFVISSNDCLNGKPDAEPYKKAIEKYKIHENKCFIFEDSKSGIISAKKINPKLLIGIETLYDHSNLINYGVDFSIKNYKNFDLEYLLTNDKLNNFINNLKKHIKTNISIHDIKNIHIDHNKLKGGFIADVIGFKVTTHSEKKYSLILKYENKNVTNLSSMANQLKLYDREYYFYTNISKNININIPKFYNIIVDESNNKIGMVLENLFDKKYKINLNLNTENIDITLKIVDRMAKMHSKFWNEKLDIIYPELNKSNDIIFRPFIPDFINSRYELFKEKWFKIFNESQINNCNEIYKNFNEIQERFSKGNNLTFIHGDIKSPNIFYDAKNNFEPYFIDWQHCAIGKGVQDLIFFIIESFDINNIKSIFNLLKEYYYKKIMEYGISSYTFEEYESDIYDSICYIPFFTSIWFGTIPQDELIDKNFPFFFINKLFYLVDIVKNTK